MADTASAAPPAAAADDFAALVLAETGWLAAQRCSDLLGLSDFGRPDADLHAAQALRAAGRMAEAEGLLATACQAFPQSAACFIEHAWLAHLAGDWPEALHRWRTMAGRFPELPEAAYGHAVTLARSGDPGGAEAVLAAAMLRFPGHLMCAVEHAWMPYRRGDFAAAERRWRGVQRRFPAAPEAWLGLGVTQRDAGDPTAAAATFAEAVARFPADAACALHHAWLARGEPAEEIRRWRQAEQRLPGHPEVLWGGLEALHRAGLAVEAEALRCRAHGRLPRDTRFAPRFAGPAAMPLAAPDEAAQALMMRFESLGDLCEFGFVQQHFGANPLGLLRWFGTSLAVLLDMLDCRFAGLGDPSQTEIYLLGEEYAVRDRRFGIAAHTFTGPHQAQAEQLHGRQAKRLGFLRRKLLEELGAAEKIFVFRTPGPPGAADAAALLAALRRHHPANVLLWVCRADAAHPAGSLVMPEPGLMLGRLARLKSEEAEWDIDFAGWLGLCREALRLRELRAAA